MARNLFWIFTENKPVQGLRKKYNIPDVNCLSGVKTYFLKQTYILLKWTYISEYQWCIFPLRDAKLMFIIFFFSRCIFFLKLPRSKCHKLEILNMIWTCAFLKKKNNMLWMLVHKTMIHPKYPYSLSVYSPLGSSRWSMLAKWLKSSPWTHTNLCTSVTSASIHWRKQRYLVKMS